ncbi:MAG: protein translocase subunit SecD [Synechococcales cyanobacterium RM1_1_8]|nr:protein translocase subunit SecD [Synechococcales cyanobacterium RM1_1_8]
MGKQRGLLALILALAIGAVVVLVKVPPKLGLDLQGGSQLTVLVKPTAEIPEISPQNLEDVTRVLENRVNGLGVAESVVQTTGEDQILVQLPGVSDPAQAEKVLGGTAQLEFRAQKQGSEAAIQAERLARQEIEVQALAAEASGDAEALASAQASLRASDESIAQYFEAASLSGEDLQDAYATTGAAPGGSNWEVGLRFTGEGGDRFAELTKNIAGTGRGLGIFLDNALISSPVVDASFATTGITGGSAVINGNFDSKEAANLAIQLRGGSLPLPVEVVETRTVGATLGRDSIQRSLYAGALGLVLVLIFMALYYRLPGIIADISLVVYALLTLAAFALLGVTLTLPGIAGFILSIGMAVDANVLIFERTREELQAGKSLYRSVESGFFRAFSSILDSNVTTLIACGALFWKGTGFVKGFAVTLAVGVLVSMFTAITCSRTLMFTAITLPQFKNKSLFLPGLKADQTAAKT